jgi:hypothetical protein
MKQLLPLLVLIPSLLFAQNVWNGTADISWYNSSESQFTITTAEQLAGLAQLVNSGSRFYEETIVLGANIVLNDITANGNWQNLNENNSPTNTWAAIGNSYSNSFCGTFDGSGYVISGIYINSASDYQGLFGYVGWGGTIKNLGVKAFYVKGSDYVGGLAGYNMGTIANSYATGNVVGANEVGGLVGYNDYYHIIANSYYNSETSGQAHNGNGIPKTTEYMQSEEFVRILQYGVRILSAIFPVNTWIHSPSSYPTLSNTLAESKSIFARGEGTEGNPYIIETKKQLEDFSFLVNFGKSFKEEYIKLGNNITLNNTANWKSWNENNQPANTWAAIGNSSAGFRGTFDGGGYVISGIYINSASDYQGLFGYVVWPGTIKNLGVKDFYVKGGDNVGGLVGCNNATIINSYTTGNVVGTNSVGGLVGNNSFGSGGGSIFNSYVIGNVVGTGDYVGGLAGYNLSYSTIVNSYATGNVVGTGDYVGGLTGVGANITNSYYNSETSGQAHNGNGIPKTTEYMQSEEFVRILQQMAGILHIALSLPANTWIYSPSSYPTLSNTIAESGIASYFARGEGTEGNPYIIETKKQLEDFSFLVNFGKSFEEEYIKLGNNITINDTANWKSWNENNQPANTWAAIGNSSTAFQGTFDGGGYVISGVYINFTGGDNYQAQGLFGQVYGTIKNLGVKAFYIKGRKHVGGLVGYSNYGTISSSYATGNVVGEGYVGGLVGQNGGGTISNSYATGNVVGEEYVGGLAGYNYGTISNSYATGNVVGTGDYYYCYVGGLVGYNDGTIANSYATGNVVGNSEVGGLVGYNNDGTITSSYYNSETSGQSDTDKGTPKTTVEMKNKNTYIDWDFETVWGIAAGFNDGMPYLLSETFPKIPNAIEIIYRKGLKLADVEFPLAGYQWVAPETPLSAGEREFDATYVTYKGNGKVKVNVAKADPIYDPPTNLTATYGQTLANITLTDGWSWIDAAASVGNTGTQTHKAKFTPSDTDNYNTIENINVAVIVSKADPIYELPTNLTATYGQTLADVDLTDGWSWMNAATSVGNAGTQTHLAKFKPDDTDNYNTIENINVAVTVSKADPIYELPTNLTAAYGQTLADVALTGGWSWMNTETSVGNAGTQTHLAKFTPDDTDNYNTIENINVAVTVSKADPIYELPTNLTATYGQTLADVTLSGGWSWMNTTALVGSIGTQTHKAIFTPTDAANYNIVTEIDVTVTISKNPGTEPAFPSIAAISAIYEEGLKLGNILLPESYSYVEPSLLIYPGNNQKFEAIYALNYTQPIVGTVTVNVSKNPGKEPAFPAISVNATFRNGLTLANITLPSGYAWAEPSTKISSPGDGQQFNATHTNSRYALPSTGKITVNASAGTGFVAINSWTYGEKPGVPLTETTTNGAATLRYTGKTNSGANYSSTRPPSEAGKYTLTATFAAKGSSGEIVRTAEFTVERAEGMGAVRIDGWKSGFEASNPLVESETNGTKNVSYIYRSIDGTSYAPQPSKPSNAGNYMLIAIFPETNNYTEARDSTYFTISKPDAIELTVVWSNDSVFTYNKMVPRPVPTVKHNGIQIPLIVLKTRSEAGEYKGVMEAIALIEDEALRKDYILKNNTKSYEIIKRPLLPYFTVENPSENFDAREDTVWVPRSIFSNPDLLRNILAELIDYEGFARDTIKNESDNASVLRGSPQVEVVYENPDSQAFFYRRVETTRKATAIIVTEDVSAKNYTIIRTSVTVVETVEEDGEQQVSCSMNFNCAPMSRNSCLAIGGEAVASCTMRCSVGNACAPMPVGSCAIMEGKIVDVCPSEPSEPIEPVLRPQLSGGSLRIWQTASGMVNVDLGYMPAAPVVLRVYDLKGKLVAAQQVNTRFASVMVNVPSGVYLFRVGSRVSRAAAFSIF